MPARPAAPVAQKDVAIFLNTGLPLDMLVTLARHERLPATLRTELATVAWTRALPLGRPDVAARLAPSIKARFAGSAALVERLLAETDVARWRQSGALLMARYPGMTGNISPFIRYEIDVADFAYPHVHSGTDLEQTRDNWWHTFAGSKRMHAYAIPLPPAPAFLRGRAAAALRAERNTLAALPSGTDYLGTLVLAHAARAPRDARLPQALSMLIRAQGGDAYGTAAVPMFRHLHRYFAGSEWAKRTPSQR